jgi:DNA-binding transcriptional LysR family regulator
MELRQLATFVTVAEERSFTRAGARLRTAQSAVSATVRRLERELDVELFDRSTHRVELSSAGEALLPEARRTLAAAEAAREAVDQVRGGLRGTVVLGAMQAQGMRAVSIAAILARFRAEHPGVHVRLHQAGSAEMAGLVRDGRVDLAVVALPGRPPAGVELTRIATEPIHFACAPGHRLAGRSHVELPALAGETFAELPPGWGVRMAVDQAFAAAGARRTIEFEVNDTWSVIDLVRHGLAVSFLPASLLDGDDSVTLVPIRRHAPAFTTSLAMPANRPLGAAARALRDAIISA